MAEDRRAIVRNEVLYLREIVAMADDIFNAPEDKNGIILTEYLKTLEEAIKHTEAKLEAME